jgi:hypothetical protein
MRTARLVLLILLIAGAALSMGVAALGAREGGSLAEVPSDCPVRVEGFRQAVIFYRGPNRVLIEAERACGSRRGDLLALENVTFTIQSGGKTFARIHSSEGTFSPHQRLVVVGRSDRARDTGCLRGVDVLSLDLATGELRAPGLRKFLGARSTLSCGGGRSS